MERQGSTKVKKVDRAARYTYDQKIEVFTRPFGMRFYRFPLEVINLSTSGFLFGTELGFLVPYQSGTLLHTTLDIYSVLFERPLHFDVKVFRRFEKDNKQFFGVGIIHVSPEHKELFQEGMQKLANLGMADR